MKCILSFWKMNSKATLANAKKSITGISNGSNNKIRLQILELYKTYVFNCNLKMINQ